MQSINGFLLTDGSIFLTGETVSERMDAAEKFKPGSWPWQGEHMQGDVRASVAWPDRDVTGGSVHPNGALCIGVLDSDGMLRVVTMRPFNRVGSGPGNDGLGIMLRDIVCWGVNRIIVQCDNDAETDTWWRMVKRDPASARMKIPVQPCCEMERALGVWQEMKPRIIVPIAVNLVIEMANARGEVVPELKALAMLAMSYKMDRGRPGRNDMRWEEWM